MPVADAVPGEVLAITDAKPSRTPPKDGTGRPRGARSEHVLAHNTRQVIRALAIDIQTRAQIAREYGVTRSAITHFAARHAREIHELQLALETKVEDRLAGMWIADQENRIALLQWIAEHAIDTRDIMAALRYAAEELGQLPPRSQVVVVPVHHVIEGVDTELLK